MREERRRYFRIDDVLGIYFRVLGAQETNAFIRESTEQGNHFDFISNFDNRIHTLLNACKVQSPIAAELIDLMNKKLNFIIQQLAIDTDLLKSVDFQSKPVNISACGAAFPSEQCLNVGAMLQLDILLAPSDLHIVTLARVIACKKMDHESCTENLPYYVRVDFSQINDNDQELLIQHVVRRQSEQLKHHRCQNMTDNQGESLSC